MFRLNIQVNQEDLKEEDKNGYGGWCPLLISFSLFLILFFTFSTRMRYVPTHSAKCLSASNYFFFVNDADKDVGVGIQSPTNPVVIAS